MNEFLKDAKGKPSTHRRAFNLGFMYIFPAVIAVFVLAAIVFAALSKESLVTQFIQIVRDLCGLHVAGTTTGVISGHVKEAFGKSDEPIQPV